MSGIQTKTTALKLQQSRWLKPRTGKVKEVASPPKKYYTQNPDPKMNKAKIIIIKKENCQTNFKRPEESWYGVLKENCFFPSSQNKFWNIHFIDQKQIQFMCQCCRTQTPTQQKVQPSQMVKEKEPRWRFSLISAQMCWYTNCCQTNNCVYMHHKSLIGLSPLL